MMDHGDSAMKEEGCDKEILGDGDDVRSDVWKLQGPKFIGCTNFNSNWKKKWSF